MSLANLEFLLIFYSQIFFMKYLKRHIIIILSICILMSEKKKAQASIGNTFSSFSTSDLGDQSFLQSGFYEEFVKTNSLQNAKIIQSYIKQKDQHGKSIKPYGVYSIAVTTIEIQYNIERRYSSFRQLYKQLQKKLNLKLIFPKKTFLTSSVDQKVIQHRRQQLNKFIEQLLSHQKKSNLIEFYEFLDIRNIYNKEKIILGGLNQIYKKSDQEIIIDLLSKLNSEPENIQVTIKQMEKQIFDNRIKVSSQTIRNMFIGLGKRKGILTHCLELTQNYFICLRGLEFINKLLSFQQNRDAERYIIIFEKCNQGFLKINKKFIHASQIKINYFKLLEIQLKRNSEINYREMMKLLFENNQELISQFQFWYKSREKNSLNVELFQDLPPPPKINKKSSLIPSLVETIEYMYSEKLNWIKVKSFQSKNYQILLERFENNLMKFTYRSNKSISELQSIFFHSNKWNKKIQSYKLDQFSKVIQYTMNLNTTRDFKFTYQFDKSQVTILKKIPRGIEEEDSYYEIIKIEKQKMKEQSECRFNRITILSHFNTMRSQEYFKSEIFGQTSYIFDSIKDISDHL